MVLMGSGGVIGSGGTIGLGGVAIGRSTRTPPSPWSTRSVATSCGVTGSGGMIGLGGVIGFGGTSRVMSKASVIGPVVTAVVWMSKPRLPKRTYPAGRRQGSVGWQGSVGANVVTPGVTTLAKRMRTPPPSRDRPTLTPKGVLRAVIPSWLTAKLCPPIRTVLERAGPLLAATL